MTGSRRLRADPAVRGALGVWLASRLAVVLLALGGARLLSGAAAGDVPGFLASWQHWDAELFQKVAQYGYTGYPERYPDRAVRPSSRGCRSCWRSCTGSCRTGRWPACSSRSSPGASPSSPSPGSPSSTGCPARGSRSTSSSRRTPCSSPPATARRCFLALAVPGWLCARRGSWRAAGLLVAAAAAVRVNGLFLAVGLVVQYAVTVRRPRRDALFLLAPFAAVLGYVGYLHALTGDWLRWPHTQAEGWDRRLTAPWTALRATLGAAGDPTQGAEYA